MTIPLTTILPFSPIYFTNLQVNNAKEIKKVKFPFMWIHGIEDDFLNINTHGEFVYKNYQGSYSEAYRIVGGTHSNVPIQWGLDNYKSTLLKFIVR